MGHQVNFYALVEDYSEIEARLRHLDAFAILYSRSPTAALRVAPTLDLKDGSGTWLFYFLVREADLGAVVNKPVRGQDYWMIDDLRTPAVKLSAGFFDGKILRRGRFYYMDGDYDSTGTWIEWPEDFRRWAATVFKVTKKYLRRIDGKYVGPAAARWLETSGGKLVD